MARTSRKLVPVRKDEPFQPPAPGNTGNARAQMALDAVPATPASLSVAAAQRFDVDVQNYTVRERRAASHAMDFNGTAGSALSFVSGTGFPGFPTLALLAQLPEYRAMHEVFADECIRTWGKPIVSGDCDPAVLSQIGDEIERLRVRDVVRELVTHDQAFGRAHAAFRIAGDSTVRDTPLVPRPYTVRKNSFLGVKAVEPYWVTPNNYNSIDPWRDDFYKPSSWWMLGQEVHSTRLRCLISRPVPDMLKPAYSFAGVSMSQLAMPYIDNWLRTRQAVSDTVKQFSIVGVAMDLMQALAPGANQDLAMRAELINRYRDSRNILFLDKTQEEFFMFNVPLGGLDALQAQSQEQMAAVSHIPLVKLLGITPTGLNASSEGEIRVFYDFVRAFQRNFAQQLMNDVCTFVQLSLFGKIIPGVTWQWQPLHELNALELAEKQKSLMETHTGYATAGIVRPDQVAKVLDNDPDSPYAGVLETDALVEPADDDIAGITEYVEALTEQALAAGEQPALPAAAPADTDAPALDEANGRSERHAAGAVYLADDKVLLLQRPDGTWGLPAGGIEEGETAMQAARRELNEETGYRHRGTLHRVGLYDEMFHAFTAKTKQFPVTINDEHIGHGWFPVAELPSPLHRTTGIVVEHAQKVHNEMATDAEWKESAHPRAENGQFGTGGGKSATSKPKLTGAEKTAVNNYSGDNFLRINSDLRADNTSDPDVARIDSAIAKSTFSEPRTLYRGMTREAAKQLFVGGQIDRGMEIADKAFLSTSTDKGEAIARGFGGVILKIEAAAGAKGLDMSGLGRNEAEREVLLPRGAKMIVQGVTPGTTPGAPTVIRVAYGTNDA